MMTYVRLLAFSLTAAFQLVAQPVPSSRRSAPDSAKTNRSVRSAQSAFEAYRRNRLPRAAAEDGDCDVRVGRYCYWRGDDDGAAPPPEDPAIGLRRDALIAQLDSAARLFPGDAWVIGQEVRYLAEAGRTDDALAATARCRTEAAWCSALSGYSLHRAHRFAAADSAFRAALAQMPEAERCRWLDVSDVAESDVSDPTRSMSCAQRETYVRRLAWIGAPLWSVSGTDLLSEHFARQVRAKMAERSASEDGSYWADDERRLTIRYGWPAWFTQSESLDPTDMRPSVTGHDTGVPYYFLPSRHAIDSTAHLRDADFTLEDSRAPSGYSPAYLRSLHRLPAQIAVFRHGDSTIVVAGWEAARDTTLAGRPLAVALALATTDSVVTIARGEARNAGRISAAARVDSGVASLEVLSDDDRRAGRIRVGIPPRPRTTLALSDLLFYASSGSPTTTLDAARDSALVRDVVPARRAVGVFWESYGLSPRDGPVTYTLEVAQVGVSWMRRVAERAGLAGSTSGMRIHWQETPVIVRGIAARGVDLNVSGLRAGRYVVTLVAATEAGLAARTSREIEVR